MTSYKFVNIFGIKVHSLDAIASLVPWSQQLGKSFKKSFEFFKGRGGGSAITKNTEMQ